MKNTNKKTPAKPLNAHSSARQRWLAWASRILIFLVSALCVTSVIVFERSTGVATHEFLVGEPAPRTLFSPLEFSYVNEKVIEALRQEKSRAVSPLFTLQPGVLADSLAKTDRLFDALQKAKVAAVPRAVPPAGPQLDISKLPIPLTDASLKTFLEESSLEDLRKSLKAFFDRTLGQGILDYQKKLVLLEGGVNAITYLKAGQKEENTVPVRGVTSLNEVRESLDRVSGEMTGKRKHLKGPVLEVLNSSVAVNLQENEEETQVRRKKAADAVVGEEEKIKKDELIVQRGMLITSDERGKIEQIQKELAKHRARNQFLMIGLLVLVAYGLSIIYLSSFEKKSWGDFSFILLFNVIFLVVTILCKGAVLWPGSSSYLLPAALAPLLLVLLTQPRLGLWGAVVMTVLVAPLVKFSPDVILATLASGVAGSFAAIRVRKRSQFLQVGAAVGLSYFLVLFAFQVIEEYSVLDALQISAQGLANGLLITMPICFLLLPLFEYAFNLTTDVTLLELSDLNHPLLKKMIVEAPGTYHHSLTVSMLAESACESIGANALLARVGCYFHDIGKIARSEFFTENQNENIGNKHDKLTPTMSCLVIMNHVKEGVELGKRYQLKERILQFIPEHQGTAVIYYFYKKAMDQARPGEKVNADDFRYPGPKPQSRETAVALLSDSVEAASRSVREPSPESLRQLVRKVINDKFIDGQLDECDLTLRDLDKIQESFVYNLMAIFHTRVRYPDDPEDPCDPDIFDEGQFEKFRADSPNPLKP